MCLTIGTPKNINFQFETNRKLMNLGVPILIRHFRVSLGVSNSITVIDLFSALCAKLFQRGGKFLKYFFLLSAHLNRLLYIEGNEFKG